MRLGDLGEFGLIERIAGLASRQQDRRVVLGIGDDAALVRPPKGHDLALTTDALVEGVHFRLDQESARTVGRRALAASLSDLAAMGARPLGCVLAFSAPARFRVVDAIAMARGVLDLAGAHRAPLLGGNVSRARQTQLVLTALGSLAPNAALRRDAARVGHRVLVTGALGRAALERLRGRVRHVPEPRLRAGHALARIPAVGACIDVSDGLLADLGHLCRASGVGARLQPERIPRPRGFDAACRRLGRDPLRLATRAGEDYELLFTMGPEGPTRAQLARRLGVAVAEIGQIVAGRRILLGAERVAAARGSPGWKHF